MSGNRTIGNKSRESIFLNEHFMAAACAVVVVTSLISLFFSLRDQNSFAVFEVLTKLVTSSAMFLAFKFFKWDVAKGLMGSVLFSLMYQEAHLVLNTLWVEENFDAYLVVGIPGSLYLAAAGMAFLMTVIITINHFFINYAAHGNPKNVILNRMAIIFKFAVYLLLLVSNGLLTLSPAILWRNAIHCLSDSALLLLLVCAESHFDSFNTLRRELLIIKREGSRKK